MAGLPRLPACQQCYQRKVKCDSQRPRCEVCTKNDSECVFANPETGEIISRRELAELEDTIRQLSGVTEDESPSSQGGLRSQEGRHASLEHEEEGTGTKVAQGSGLGFMSPLFSDQEWRESNAYVLRSLANASASVEANIEPNELPSAGEAKILFDSYLRSTHIQNPTLLRRVVLALYDRMFPCETGEVRASSSSSKHDLFRTFMVLALGAVQPYRRGRYECHPFGYYLSAMRYFDRFAIRDGLEPIQDLLLISRFGIYHHIGTSVWAITRLCVRMCVEQGLHKQQEVVSSSTGEHDLLQEQLRRRVFWVCYMMDRYSSITLNRPFAISDDDIEVGMVADADDEYLDEMNLRQDGGGVVVPRFDDLTGGSSSSSSKPSPATEMSAFIACVRLRQISSRIHRYFADTLHAQISTAAAGRHEPFLATGHIHVALRRFLDELERWRASAPIYDAPQCLFERAEWYDLQRAREVFNLLRRVLDVAPKRRDNGGAAALVPPKSLLAECQSSAVTVIELYSDMYARSIATYTRSYFQMMFTAGLSLLYCGSVLAARTEPSQVEACGRALEQCRVTLTQMTVDLPDARHYVAVFEALFRHISRNLKLNHVSNNVAYAEHIGVSAAENSELGAQHASGYQFPYAEQQQHQQQQHHYLRDGAGGIDPMYAMSIPAVMGDGNSNYLSAEGLSVIDSGMWNWDVLNDEALWNVGQYVIGDPSADFGIYDPS